MAELSGHWTTIGSGPTGDQQVSYTQAQLSTAYKVMAACANFEGVAYGLAGSLACSANGANTVAVATGGAMVDGKWYYNDASLNVNVPSAVGVDNTRIDRIVLRANWAGYEVAVTRIAGTDAASPTAPAITTTSGTTYDVPLCQVLVDTAGAVTATDERTVARPYISALSVLGRSGNVAGVGQNITGANGQVLRVSGTTLGFGTIVAAGIANDAIDSQHYAAGSIDLEHMSANSVDSDQYVDGSIDLAHMSANSVDSGQYVDGSIDRVHLAADIVDGTKIADDAVNSEHIAAGAVDLEHMSANSVDSDQYVDGSIDTAHLANDVVDDTKAGNRVPMLTRRIGGHSSSWNIPGTTTYTPSTVKMQCGAATVTIAGGQSQGYVDVTFPQEFSNNPLVLATSGGVSGDAFYTDGVYAATSEIGVASVRIRVHVTSSSGATVAVHWLAIGPE